MKASNKEQIKYIALFLVVAPPFMGLTSGKVNALLMVLALIIVLLQQNNVIISKSFCLWSGSFTGVSFASYLWAVNNTTVVSTTLSYIQIIILVLVVVTVCQKEEDLEYTIKCMKFGAIIYIIQRIVTMLISGYQITGRIGGGNQVSIRLTMLAVLLFARRKNTKTPGTFWPLITLFVLFAFLQGSRKGFIIVIIGMTMVVLMEAKIQNNLLNYVKTVVCILVIVVIAYLLCMKWPVLYNTIGIRIEKTFAFLDGTVADASTRDRNLLMLDAIRMWKAHPILGVGQDSFRYVNHVKFGYYSHNNYCELLANLGIVGLFIYYSYIISQFVKSCKMFNKKHLCCLIPSCTILLLTLITDFFQVSYSSECTYVFLAYAFACVNICGGERLNSEQYHMLYSNYCCRTFKKGV